MTKKIPISNLASMLLCEYKIFLQHVQKLKGKTTKEFRKKAQAGKKVHSNLKKNHDRIVDTYNDKVKEIQETDKPQEEKEKEIESIEKPEELKSFREYTLSGDKIKGRADEVIFEDNYIKIIDDKSHDRVFDSDKLQVYGYALAILQKPSDDIIEKYEGHIVIKCAIRNHATGLFIWEKTFDDEDRAYVEDKVNRYIGILDETITPTSSNNPGICKSCSMRNYCDRKVVDEVNDIIF